MPEAVFGEPAPPDRDISIVVVSHNTREVLRDTLRTAFEALAAEEGQGLRWELWVSDNASTDGSPDLVAQEFPRARLIRNPDNAGFSAGNNRALRQCRGRVLLLLNSDTLSASGLFSGLVRFFDNHPKAGACSPRLKGPDGAPQRFAYGREPTVSHILRRRLIRLLTGKDLHDWGVQTPQTVDWVSGACLAVRREAVAQAGLMDEDFFVYFEDVDWCRRIRLAGWTVHYHPDLEITHLGGATLRRSPRSQAEYRRSRAHYFRKHYGPLSRLFARWLLPG